MTHNQGETMTAEQLIKRHIMLEAIEYNDDLNWDGDITVDNVDQAWQEVMVDNEAHWDFLGDFRSSGVETDIKCDWSRHYEAKSHARQLSCGTWVGWTYWYGGGKHGEPGSMPWLEHAYVLDVTEEEKVVTVRTFKKVGE